MLCALDLLPPLLALGESLHFFQTELLFSLEAFGLILKLHLFSEGFEAKVIIAIMALHTDLVRRHVRLNGLSLAARAQQNGEERAAG